MTGGGCTGVAFRIEEDLIAPELDLLWRREMVARGYIPRWVPLHSPAGALIGHGIAFTIDPEGPGYCDLEEAVVVRRRRPLGFLPPLPARRGGAAGRSRRPQL